MKVRKLKRKLYPKYCDFYGYLIVVRCRFNRPINIDDLINPSVTDQDGMAIQWLEGYWFELIDRYPKLWDVCFTEDTENGEQFIDIHLGATKLTNQQYYINRDAMEVIEHLKSLDYFDLDIRYLVTHVSNIVNTSEIFEDE